MTFTELRQRFESHQSDISYIDELKNKSLDPIAISGENKREIYRQIQNTYMHLINDWLQNIHEYTVDDFVFKTPSFKEFNTYQEMGWKYIEYMFCTNDLAITYKDNTETIYTLGQDHLLVIDSSRELLIIFHLTDPDYVKFTIDLQNSEFYCTVPGFEFYRRESDGHNRYIPLSPNTEHCLTGPVYKKHGVNVYKVFGIEVTEDEFNRNFRNKTRYPDEFFLKLLTK